MVHADVVCYMIRYAYVESVKQLEMLRLCVYAKTTTCEKMYEFINWGDSTLRYADAVVVCICQDDHMWENVWVHKLRG